MAAAAFSTAASVSPRKFAAVRVCRANAAERARLALVRRPMPRVATSATAAVESKNAAFALLGKLVAAVAFRTSAALARASLSRVPPRAPSAAALVMDVAT